MGPRAGHGPGMHVKPRKPFWPHPRLAHPRLLEVPLPERGGGEQLQEPRRRFPRAALFLPCPDAGPPLAFISLHRMAPEGVLVCTSVRENVEWSVVKALVNHILN